MDHAEAFLRDQIPVALRALVPQTLKTAYAAAATLIKDEPILNVESAKDNWGRVIQWAVDLGFERLVRSGQWPFDCRWATFERPTGRYLEILPSHSVITISQVADPSKQPRDVCFRANKRLNGQGQLFASPSTESPSAGGAPHILLLHGHQTLNFAYLGIPREDHKRGYLYRSGNLMLLPHLVSVPEEPVEVTDFNAVMTLKEEIDRWRKDNAV